MIQYIRTNQYYNIDLMQTEVKKLSEGNWKAHYNTAHYEGDWSILPLRSINGNLDNTIAIHASSSHQDYADTALLNECVYLQSVLDSFKCDKTSVRLMKLNAGAIIKEHTDHDLNLEAGEARFHIPVITNTDVAFFIRQDRIPMLEGECWYLNLSLPHRVHNAGKKDRIHLVIDCLVNDWVKDLLNQPGLIRKDFEEVSSEHTFSTEEQQKIINELRKLNTPAAMQLIEKMEASVH